MTQPTPQPTGGPNLPPLDSIVAAANTATGSTQTTGEYGLSKDAAGAQFDLSGLTGLGSGKVTGNDLINAFLAAGTAGDQAHYDIVAAIQQALLYAGYYDKSYVPNFGVAKTQDAKALAAAINNLYDANKVRPQPQSLAQWLSGQASIGVTSGAAGAQAAVPSVLLTAPNSEDVAAIYQKVATETLGHKPSADETAAFVQNYTQSYLANQKANAAMQYDAKVQKAQAKMATQTVRAQPAVPQSPQQQFIQGEISNENAGPPPESTQGQFVQGEINDLNNPPQTTPDQSASLLDSMQTLQDVINQRSREATGQTSSGINVVGVQNSPESADVAAQNFARNTHPNEAAAADLNNTFAQFLQILNGKVD